MADTRILHVSSTYADYYNWDVSAELEQMSKNILNRIKGQHLKGFGKKYFDTFGANKSNADMLQKFFQALKEMGNNDSGQLSSNLAAAVDQQVISKVLSSYRSYNGAGLKGGAKKRIFNTRSSTGAVQGAAFEKELASVISAVRLQVEGRTGEGLRAQFRQEASSMQLGTEQTNFKNIIHGSAKNVIKGINNNMPQVICANGSKLSEYVTKSVSGKIDVSGLALKWTISASANSYLQKIALLLSQASFTAKSYSSLVFDKTTGKQHKSSKDTLSLGNTNTRRVFYTVLMAQGIPVKVAESIYQHINRTHNDEERKNAQRLRILYELTGYGQNYINNMINNQLKRQLGGAYANYIIFNDPATNNIYVKTTAEVWQKMEESYLENFFEDKLSIPKSWFT